jgi:putative endonuclease
MTTWFDEGQCDAERDGTMPYWVYIMTNRRHGTLYTGITNSLSRRVEEHRSGAGSAFVAAYGLDRLVYAEAFDTPAPAIAHEKRLKRWKRSWKLELIEKSNPEWDDLSTTIHLD